LFVHINQQQHVIVDFHLFTFFLINIHQSSSSIQPDTAPVPAAIPFIMSVTHEELLRHISQIKQAIRQGIREKNIKAVMKAKKAALVSGYII
jgi:hypothetical protein